MVWLTLHSFVFEGKEMLKEEVRMGYQVLSCLVYNYGPITFPMTFKEIHQQLRPRFNDEEQVRFVCDTLVRHDLLLAKQDTVRVDVVYKLARAPGKILLVDIHRAFDPERHLETSSIVLFIDHLFGQMTLRNLYNFEKTIMDSLVNAVMARM